MRLKVHPHMEAYGHIAVIARILLNTGLRPPQEILGVEKEHINLTNSPRRFFYQLKGKKTDALIPPGGMFVLRAKDGGTRIVPLNNLAREIFSLLLSDSSTGRWLFLNPDGKPLQSFKKGFAQTCERAGIKDLRPYDLRHTFATRLVDRGVHQYVISALLGHCAPVTGFGYAPRITPGYAHVTWEAMVRAVEALETEPPKLNVFQPQSGKSQANQSEPGVSVEAAKVS